LNVVNAQSSNCVLIGDRCHLGFQYQQSLFEENKIELLASPARKNQLNPGYLVDHLAKWENELRMLKQRLSQSLPNCVAAHQCFCWFQSVESF